MHKRSEGDNVITNPIPALNRSALMFISLILTASANAQQQVSPSSATSETQVLQQLVTEVRQLRLTLERTNATSSRLQLTLQRIQLEQNQVNRISSQLESVRNEIVRSETEQGQVSGDLANIESRLSEEQNPSNQKQLQGQQKYMKAVVDQKARVVQDERTREAELTSSLQSEQSKLNELQARLDSLEKLIEEQSAH
jgi:chromosome segregation ATPase